MCETRRVYMKLRYRVIGSDITGSRNMDASLHMQPSCNERSAGAESDDTTSLSLSPSLSLSLSVREALVRLTGGPVGYLQ